MTRAVLGLVALLACASPVLAQPIPTDPPVPLPDAPKIEAKEPPRPWIGVSLGLGWEKVITTSGHASNPLPFRFLFRTPLRTGWSPAPMFGWFRSELDAVELGSPRTPMGRLTVRPVLMGIRYTWVRDDLSWDVAGAAGVSFNGFRPSAAVGPVLGIGTGTVETDANTSFAWRLQASAWHDFTDRLAVRGSLAYAWCRPEITFTSRSSSRRISENANSIQLGAGIVYRLF
jgi:hypothetical protein